MSMTFELYIEDLKREIDILNFYKMEAAKRKDIDAVVIGTAEEQQDAVMYHMRSAVTDVLMMANPKALKFVCDYRDDKLIFDLSPLREEKMHLLDILKEAVRQYIVYEVRRLWLMNVAPDMADNSLRVALEGRIKDVVKTVTRSERLRRRCTDLAGI